MSKQPINYAVDQDYAVEVTMRLNKAFESVKRLMKISRDRAEEQYNKRAKTSQIFPGSIVLLRNETGKSEKNNSWPTRYLGPYRVIKTYNNNCLIKGIYADRNEQCVHFNRVKLAHMRGDDAYPYNNISTSPRGENETRELPTAEQSRGNTAGDIVQRDAINVPLNPQNTRQTEEPQRAPTCTYNLRSRR